MLRRIFCCALLVVSCQLNASDYKTLRAFKDAAWSAENEFNFTAENCCVVARYLHNYLSDRNYVVAYTLVLSDNILHVVVCNSTQNLHITDDLLCVDNGAATGSHVFTYGELKRHTKIVTYSAGQCLTPEEVITP